MGGCWWENKVIIVISELLDKPKNLYLIIIELYEANRKRY